MRASKQRGGATLLAVAFALLPALPIVPAASPVSVVLTFADTAEIDWPVLGALSQRVTPLAILPGAIVATDLSRLDEIASLPFILRIEEVSPIERHNDRATRLSRADAPLRTLDVTGEGVTVAVVDSGIDTRHPDLEGRVVANLRLVNGEFRDSPTDSDGHGTHVAGIVAGSGAASGGRYTGVAPGAKLVGLDISDDFDSSSALMAFDWLLTHKDEYGIRVVVNSWGRAERVAFDSTDPVVVATDRLVRSGIVVVFSASNHGPTPSSLSVEAQNPNVVTVGATDDTGTVALYSSRGPARVPAGEAAWVKPDVVAAGTDVVSLRSTTALALPAGINGARDLADNPHYREMTGTSQSAPLVAGVIACMIEANPALTPRQVARMLRESAVDLGVPGPDSEYGFGLLDAVDAVRLARGAERDLGNTLIAGGTERYVDRGDLAPAPAPRGLLPLSAPVAAARAETTFPVKVGASRIDVEFRFTPASDSFQLTLAEGSTLRGTWAKVERVGDEGVIRGSYVPTHPAILRIIAEGTSLTSVNWTAIARVAMRPDPSHATVLDPRYAFDGPAEARDPTLMGRLDYFFARARLDMRLAAEHPDVYIQENPGKFAIALAAIVGVGLALGMGAGSALNRFRTR